MCVFPNVTTIILSYFMEYLVRSIPIQTVGL